MFSKLIFSAILCCGFSPIIKEINVNNESSKNSFRYYENMTDEYINCLNGNNTFTGDQYTYQFKCPFNVWMYRYPEMLV